MAVLAPVLKHQFFDGNGDPLSGGKLYSYVAGTSTPLATYNDASGAAANTNPIILDSAGRCDLWVPTTNAYKFVMKDADDVTLWTVDNVIGTGASISSGTGFSAWVKHDVTDGQSATALSGETVDGANYSSAVYEVEIIRGTTVFANGTLALQYRNSTWRVVTGGFITSEAHGVTFAVSVSGTVATLTAALDSGAGNGTIKLSRRLIAA